MCMVKMGRIPCCSKDSTIIRGAWTAQEDSILTQYITIHGEGRWRSIPQNTGLKRCGKSCRLRWLNYLRPNIKRGSISPDEEDLILRLHGLIGNRWSLIAGRLPSRTDNEIKNYWNTHLSRKIQSPPQKKTISHPCDHGFKSPPVKAKAVRIRNSIIKYGISSEISNHQEMSPSNGGVSQLVQSSCNLQIKKDNSDSINFRMDTDFVKSQSPSMEINGQYQIPQSELFSPEFDACTSIDINQLLDHNMQENSFTANEEQEKGEMEESGNWVEELQNQQDSCLQWLSLLLLESEEEIDGKNKKEPSNII